MRGSARLKIGVERKGVGEIVAAEVGTFDEDITGPGLCGEAQPDQRTTGAGGDVCDDHARTGARIGDRGVGEPHLVIKRIEMASA